MCFFAIRMMSLALLAWQAVLAQITIRGFLVSLFLKMTSFNDRNSPIEDKCGILFPRPGLDYQHCLHSHCSRADPTCDSLSRSNRVSNRSGPHPRREPSMKPSARCTWDRPRSRLTRRGNADKRSWKLYLMVFQIQNIHCTFHI